MLLAVLFSVDLWQNGLLALGSVSLPNVRHWPGPPLTPAPTLHPRSYFLPPTDHWSHHSHQVWSVTGLVLGLSLLSAAHVFFMADSVFALSSIYLSAAVALHGRRKPVPVLVAVIVGAVLVLVAMLASVGWTMMRRDREGGVRLDGAEGEGDFVPESVRAVEPEELAV